MLKLKNNELEEAGNVALLLAKHGFRKRRISQCNCKNSEEAQKQIEQGFEYVTEFDGMKLFRKRK